MAGKFSKNARRGQTKDQLIHRGCGGTIVMRTIIAAGKARHYAKCDKCEKMARRPKDLM
jgi:hypothetical protein